MKILGNGVLSGSRCPGNQNNDVTKVTADVFGNLSLRHQQSSRQGQQGHFPKKQESHKLRQEII